MKFNWIVLLSSLTLASAVYAASNSAPAPASKKSADGVDLPAATAERKLRATVPYASIFLGARPEEVGRVFSAAKSAALLAKHVPEDIGCDWFVMNVDGTDVVGMSLTDGRVSKVALFYDTINQIRIDNMRKQLDAHPDHAVKVDLKPINGDGKKLSLLLTFEVDPLEFYLATHTLDPKIAAALRQHAWAEGMTDEQALMVGDGPGRYAATYAADSTSSAKPGEVGAGTVFSDTGGGSAPGDVVIVIEARNKKEARAEALKRHKNLKDIARISGTDDKAAAKK